MKNLTKLTEVIDDVNLDNKSVQFKLFTIDNINNIIFIVSDDNQFIIYNPSSKKISLKIELNKQDIISEGAFVIAIQFIPDLEAICMATDKGDILMYTIPTNQLECVGVVGTSGISCMSWSPDYELFIIATVTGTLIQMTKDWDIITEVPIDSQLPGKPLITPVVNNNNNSGNVEIKSQPPTITWRGDGQYFSCSSFDQNLGKFVIRIWERNLILHSISESNVTGLESKIHWRPNGSLIAASQRIPAEKRHDISFFERNGLKHGEFSLRDKYSVEAIQWSSDSEILALHLTHEEGDKRSIIQLWHRSNYYWFLKQELQFDQDQEVSFIQWDSSAVSLLRVITKQQRYHEIRFCWDYDISPGFTESNPSSCVMVDGKDLKLTPFRRLVVPPPMSAYSIQLSGNCLGFSFNHTTYQILTITSDNSIGIYTPATLPPIPTKTSQTLPNYSIAPTLTATIKNQNVLKLHKLRHLVWINESTLVAIESGVNSSDSIVQLSFSVKKETSEIVLGDLTRVLLPSRVLRLIRQATPDSTTLNDERLLFELIDGSVYIYNSLMSSFIPFISNIQENIFKFPTPCLWISSVISNGEDAVVGLNDRNRLYINQTLISQDCNSYACHNKFLLFTTVSHVLRSVPLALPAPTTPLSYQQPAILPTGTEKPQHSSKFSPPPINNYDDSIREVERGSRIVAVVPHDTRLVLQMPRGNLETISPRSLTLSTIRELLSQHQYEKAFTLMRRNRIDMNLIYDYNPKDFIQHIEEFVNQVKSIDFLNLFISSLRDEDTTKTLFIDLETNGIPSKNNSNNNNNNNNNNNTTGKINLICDKLREVFIKKDSIQFNLPILTTYVKKSPPELDQVLRLIQSLRGEEINDQGETVINRLSEESLDYIVFLVDVNKLYDIALGTYDFELVIMVAQKSQKDPKEYMSFLTELQKMEKFYQRYSIDKYLSRWVSALENLSEAGDQYFDDCIDIIKTQKIYKEAIQIYSKKSETHQEQFNQVQEIYGDYLIQSNLFLEAGFMYSSAGQYKKAIQSFKDDGSWELSLLQSVYLKYSPEETKALCYDLSDHLKRLNKYKESAEVLLHTSCQDYQLAINTLIEGLYWTDAFVLANTHNLPISKQILLENLNTQQNEIKDQMESYQKYFTRIQIVRQNKLNYQPLILPKSSLDPETSSVMSGMSGMFSEGGGSVSSQASTSTYVSTYSSQTGTFSQATKSRVKKNKVQKPKKVRLSGKEGSQFEEEYLVEEMKKLIPTSINQDVIGRIIRGLVIFKEFNKAKELQSLYSSYLQLIDDSLSALSASATAILPENKKEKEREYEYLQQQLEQHTEQQQANNNNNKSFTLSINKITITREKSNWNLNIF